MARKSYHKRAKENVRRNSTGARDREEYYRKREDEAQPASHSQQKKTRRE